MAGNSPINLDQQFSDDQLDRLRQLKRWNWLLTKVQDVDLNDWEDRFISDLMRKRDRQGSLFSLTDAQEEKLEQIANRLD